MLEDILTIITTVPAIAWFVTSFIKVRKMYEENQTEIKEKTKTLTQQGVQKIHNLQEKVQQKIEKQPDENDDPNTNQL